MLLTISSNLNQLTQKKKKTVQELSIKPSVQGSVEAQIEDKIVTGTNVQGDQLYDEQRHPISILLSPNKTEMLLSFSLLKYVHSTFS